MSEQIKNMLIGIFVAAACSIIVFLLMFLHPSIGDQGRLFRVRFADIDKISIGTRVSFAGKPVGEVIDIRELPDVDTERKTINGYVYVYELTLRVDTGVNIFNTDSVSSRTSGLLGEKSIAITPGGSKVGESVYLINEDIIYATETGGVEETLKEFKTIATKIETTLTQFNRALTTLQKGKFWEHLNETALNIHDISTALNRPQDWSETLSSLHHLAKQVDGTWSHVDHSVHTLNETLAHIKQFAVTLNNPESSLGKFTQQDKLYLQLEALLSKADTTMNDVNHYGFLFHLDKQWQRLRARRLNLLQKLSSPQEFRNYFNDELDQIYTSLSRVSQLLSQTPASPPYLNPLLSNPEYSKVFAELIRRVSVLEEEIKLYNIQVVEDLNQQHELLGVRR